MIHTSAKDFFASHISSLLYTAKEMLTDFDIEDTSRRTPVTSSRPLLSNNQQAVIALTRHYFLLLKLSNFDMPLGYTFQNFAGQSDGHDRQMMRSKEEALRETLRRLCKIHDIDFEEIEKDIDRRWMAERFSPDAPKADKPSSNFHREGNSTEDLG